MRKCGYLDREGAVGRFPGDFEGIPLGVSICGLG